MYKRQFQAHTLWFSRYLDHAGRRGVESTISFPEPDVQFTNNTPYPVLIWPTYTDTSLTVSIYSTKWVEADVADQAIFGSGQCTIIDTDRIRTYPDGTEEIDTFRALYQPSDGIGCDGRPTDPNAPTPTPDPDEEPKKKKKKKNNNKNSEADDGGADTEDGGADTPTDDDGTTDGGDAGDGGDAPADDGTTDDGTADAPADDGTGDAPADDGGDPPADDGSDAGL